MFSVFIVVGLYKGMFYVYVHTVCLILHILALEFILFLIILLQAAAAQIVACKKKLSEIREQEKKRYKGMFDKFAAKEKVCTQLF